MSAGASTALIVPRPGFAIGPGGRPGMPIGVPWASILQIGTIDGSPEAVLEQRRVNSGRIAIELHADAQAILKYRRHDGAFLGQARFSFDHCRERHRIVNIGRRPQRLPPRAEFVRHHAADLLRRGMPVDAVFVGEKIAFERRSIGIEVPDHRRIPGGRKERFRPHRAQFAHRRRYVVDVESLGHEQLHVIDIAAGEPSEDFERRGRFIEFVFARLEIRPSPQGARREEYPAPLDHAPVGQNRGDRAGGSTAREFDKYRIGETFVGPIQKVDDPRASGDNNEHGQRRPAEG